MVWNKRVENTDQCGPHFHWNEACFVRLKLSQHQHSELMKFKPFICGKISASISFRIFHIIKCLNLFAEAKIEWFHVKIPVKGQFFVFLETLKSGRWPLHRRSDVCLQESVTGLFVDLPLLREKNWAQSEPGSGFQNTVRVHENTNSQIFIQLAQEPHIPDLCSHVLI